MSVVSVTPVWDGRAGMVGEGGVRTYSQTFEVLTNDETDTALTILLAGGIPRRYDAFPGDPFARCISIGTPSQSPESALLWYFTAQYSTAFGQGLNQRGIATDPTKPGAPPVATGDETNPLARHAEIAFGMHKYQEAMERDFYGEYIKNAAEEKLDVMRDRGLMLITIKKNLPFFNWLLWRRLCYRTNSAPFMGIGVNKVRLADFDAHSRYENSAYFYEVMAKFECVDDTDDDTRTWDIEKLNAGFTYIQRTSTLFTGTITAGSRIISAISPVTTGWKVGDVVRAAGNEFFPRDEAITSVDSSTQVTVENIALATGTFATFQLITTKRKTFTDEAGMPTTKPGLLNLFGGKLTVGAKENYVRVRAYGTYDFNALNLLP